MLSSNSSGLNNFFIVVVVSWTMLSIEVKELAKKKYSLIRKGEKTVWAASIFNASLRSLSIYRIYLPLNPFVERLTFFYFFGFVISKKNFFLLQFRYFSSDACLCACISFRVCILLWSVDGSRTTVFFIYVYIFLLVFVIINVFFLCSCFYFPI